MAGSRVGLFDNFNIPIHRDAQHREDLRRLRIRGGLGAEGATRLAGGAEDLRKT